MRAKSSRRTEARRSRPSVRVRGPGSGSRLAIRAGCDTAPRRARDWRRGSRRAPDDLPATPRAKGIPRRCAPAEGAPLRGWPQRLAADWKESGMARRRMLLPVRIARSAAGSLRRTECFPARATKRCACRQTILETLGSRSSGFAGATEGLAELGQWVNARIPVREMDRLQTDQFVPVVLALKQDGNGICFLIREART